MLVINPAEITLEELDEAIDYLFDRLKIDRYGSRMTLRRRETLLGAIDDLLDERLKLTGARDGL